MIEPDKMV